MIIGVDVGGTKTAAAVVSEDGSLNNYRVVPSVDNVAMLVDSITDLVGKVADGGNISAVGVGLPAFLNKDRNRVVSSPNLSSLDGVDFRGLLQKSLKVPVVLENDANVAVWGEYSVGAGREFSSVAMITSGTGVGGGVVLDGRLVVGAGTAAEFGHVRVVSEDGLLCGCGRYGCLELYASGRALKEIVEKAFNSKIGSKSLERLVLAGSPAAMKAVEEIGSWLGVGCVYVDRVVNPEVFIVGGGVSELGGLLLNAVVKGFEKAGGTLGFVQPEFELAMLGNTAGVVGAGLLAREGSESF